VNLKGYPMFQTIFRTSTLVAAICTAAAAGAATVEMQGIVSLRYV
jgi:hypothetical protein